MTTRVDNFPMAFVLIPDGSVTRRMLSLSTSREKSEAPLLPGGERLLEIWTPVDPLFLDYPLLTPQEAQDAIIDAADDGNIDLPWWKKIFGIS